MVLDDEQRVAEINKALQDVEKLSHVVEVQARRRFIKDVKRAYGLAFREFAGQLDALRFAPGKCGGGLRESDVGEAHFYESRELLLNLRNILEKLQRIRRGQIQDIADRLPLVADSERFRIVAPAAADFAHHINVREKIHFNTAQAVPLAGFATAAFDIETEAAGAVPALARFRQHGEEIADRRENSSIGGGIGPRRAADWRLIDFDDFVNLVSAENLAMRGRRFRRSIEFLRQRAVENVVDERGFAGAGDAGDHGQQAERKCNVHVLQIVCTRAKNLDRFSVGAAAFFRHGNFCCATQILTGERFGGGFNLRRFAMRDQVAAGVSGTGAGIDNEISSADGVFVVLDDQNGIAEVAKMLERTEKAGIVAGVEADARLVKNVENTTQARTDLRGQADALGFAAGKRGGGAVQAEIAKADGEQELDTLGNFFQRARRDFFFALAEVRQDFCIRRARATA